MVYTSYHDDSLVEKISGTLKGVGIGALVTFGGAAFVGQIELATKYGIWVKGFDVDTFAAFAVNFGPYIIGAGAAIGAAMDIGKARYRYQLRQERRTRQMLDDIDEKQ